MYVLVPMQTKSVGGLRYELCIVGYYTAKSDVLFLSDRNQFYESVR